jgi:hypothetical protein
VWGVKQAGQIQRKAPILRCGQGPACGRGSLRKKLRDRVHQGDAPAATAVG